MNTEEIVAKIFSRSWPSADELASFALERHGFGEDGGYHGVSYPGDLDDLDRANGNTIARGMVELSYWDGEIKEVLIPEQLYLQLLATHLEQQDFNQLARKIREFCASCLAG